MQKTLAIASLACLCAAAAPAVAQVTFYQDDGFRGRAIAVDRSVGNFERFGFNDEASSVVVRSGPWEICTDAHFAGSCLVLRPGSYPSLGQMDLNDQISSVRPAGNMARYEDGRRDRDGRWDGYVQRRGAERQWDGRAYRQWDSSGPPPWWDPREPYYNSQQ